MAGQGAGPSRRSHTKSRKGCKTCKRRHIRCDETFPQCRNCTKHQVQCDYMENVASETESQSSPQQPTICFTPGTENRIEQWQQTGTFPYPDLQVFPPPQTEEYSPIELRLMHHLSSTSNDLMVKGTSNLTLWTQKLPKFLSIASSYSYVMHALLSFSANHLAFTQSSSELRNLQIHHGMVALRGLHDAIGNFSHSNADAVLAASLLLLWQANDWRSWSSLRAGVQSVLSAMQSWNQDSIFSEYLTEENLNCGPPRNQRNSSSVDIRERNATLQNIIQALETLRTALAGHQAESYWIGQVHAYLLRLQSSNPALSPEDQFGQLYALRKWLFWMPVSLLQKQGGQGPAMLVLAHFYAVALALEPLFPELGPSFCAKIALSPLEVIIGVTDEMQSKHGVHQTTSMEIASLMQFPRQAVLAFRVRCVQAPSMNQQDPSMFALDTEALSYTSIGNLSPAFAPTPLQYGPGSSSSTFLEVPVSQSGFTFGTQSWGAIPSPQFPPQSYSSQDETVYSYGDAPLLGNIHGGFVAPTPIWT